MARIVSLNPWGNEALTGWMRLNECVREYRKMMFDRIIIIERACV